MGLVAYGSVLGTGLLIRDFFKDYRELRYSNSGSIGFSEIEKNAYRLALTLEVTHIDAPRYGSFKTLPENTHYGYCTLFRGSTVTDTIPVKYPRFRVFDILNQGIWNYHQLTENQQLGASTIQLSVNAASKGLWEVLGDGIGNLTEFLIGLYYRSEGAETPGWILRAFDEEEPPEEPFGNEFEQYRAYPIGSPFPDIVKFKADVPCSFLFRLEMWFLVNPIVYAVDNPTDTGDETEGEDEYPEPEQGDGNGDGDEFPAPSPIPSDRDPRDFPLPEEEPPLPPFEGGQCETAYRLQIKVALVLADDTPLESNSGLFTVQGPVTGIYRASSHPAFGGGPGIVAQTGGGIVGLAGQGPAKSISFAGIVVLERVDGNPDDCGNPPPVFQA